MISELITAAMLAVGKGLTLANTVIARAHIEKKGEILRRLRELEARPYDKQDDAEIVATYKEAKLWINEAAEIMALKG